MGKEINEDSAIKISVKALIGVGVAISGLIGLWFALQADIQEAKELPEPTITRVEYEMKDQLIRQTIMSTQEDVTEIKEDLKDIKRKLYE